MSRSDELPPDLRAALSLVLRQNKTYDEVASMLGIAPEALHDRAHAALAMLAPGQARHVPAKEREQIGEYLLGQQPGDSARLSARKLLSESEPAREWAQALVKELEPVGGELPEIPVPPAPEPLKSKPPRPPKDKPASKPKPEPKAKPAAAPKPATPVSAAHPAPSGGPVPLSSAGAADGPPWESASRSLPSSRLGGGLLLAILVAAIVVVIILVAGSGGSSKHDSKTSTKTTSSTTTSGPKEEGRFTLKSPESGSTSTGIAEILSESGKRALFVQAEHIPATKGFFYAIWLYNSTNSASPVSRSPEVGKTHAFSGAVALPGNASEFKEILVTKETSTKPTRPGHVVLRGPFSVNG
jgi:hypothetical protein